MNMFLVLAFLFFMGSVAGWVLELLFRRFVSTANPERKWINPGFCTGPYIPLYGFGLCIMFLIASLEKYSLVSSPFWNRLLLFVFAALAMTAIEYIAGILCLKITRVRLWDYSGEWGNIQGIICPKFSLIWAVLGAVYYFLIHPHILDALLWLSNNLAFSFVIGLFFGVFIIDVAHSAQLVAKLRKFAEENDVIVRYESLKTHIRSYHSRNRKRYNLFRPFRSEQSLQDSLNELKELFERKKPGKRALRKTGDKKC